MVSVWDAGPGHEPIPIKSIRRLTPATDEPRNSQLSQDMAMRVGRAWSVVLTLGAFSSLICRGAASADIEALATDRTAIERIYYNHRLGNNPPFEQLLTRTAVETLVRADLKKEAILKRVYGIEPTLEAIQVELRRIDAETRAPEMLAEIKRALNNDSARFARSVARPVVVERELRRRFENDDRLHAAQHQQAESIRRNILAARSQSRSGKNLLQMLKETKVGIVTDVTWQFGARPAAESSQATSGLIGSPVPVEARSGKYSIEATAQIAQVLTPPDTAKEAGQRFYFEDLSAELKSVLRAQLQKPGDTSAVIETPTGFLLFAAEERTTSILSAAMLSIPKRSFEQWLAEQND